MSDQDREFVYLVGETPFECCLCVNSWHTHQDRTVLLMPVILVTIVMRWRRRSRKRSIAFTTGSSRPSTSCPVVSATSNMVRLTRLGKEQCSFLKKKYLGASIGNMSNIFGAPKRILVLGTCHCVRESVPLCGGHRCVPASWHCTVRPLNSG